MSAAAPPTVIEAAVNGMVTKEQNPHVPRTVDEIVEDSLRCLDAGASIVHHHNDEPNVGGPARHMLALATSAPSGVLSLPETFGNPAADVDWILRWHRERELPVHISIFEPGFLRLILAHQKAGTFPAK